jgi:putative glutamine amidotransferase
MASFVPDTQLHSFFGDAYPVNTFHHQGITEAPEGFTLSARSDDGLAEGIEKDCILAVQWHPERLLHDAKHRAIVEAFVRKCSL